MQLTRIGSIQDSKHILMFPNEKSEILLEELFKSLPDD